MNWLWFVLSYLIMEGFINWGFHIVSRKLKSDENRTRSFWKGVLERLFLIIGLVLGYPQVIIAFGALKIGTRFQRSSSVSNDYFLIGNFISLLIAIWYSQFVIFLMN